MDVSMIPKMDEQRFEFSLYINNKIIIQRNFNVHNFNEDSLKSEELKKLADTIAGMNIDAYGKMGIIPNFLKEKSVDLLWYNYNPYEPETYEGSKNIFEKVDNFQFELKVDKNVVLKTEFSGNFFQPKVRYGVDIRSISSTIMTEIKQSLNRKKYTLN